MNIEFSDIELRVLVRVLTFVRYESEDSESDELANSPHVAELYKRITDATAAGYRAAGVPFPEGWPPIETSKGFMDSIKRRINNVVNWNKFPPEQRVLIIRTLVYPYGLSDGILNELLRFGSETHSTKT